MKQTLSDHDRSRLDELIAKTEKQTNTQIVLAVINRSDNYTELPWKAFALGVSMVGLLVFILGFPLNDWNPRITALIFVTLILAGGAGFAFLAVLIPEFAKRFLSADRAETEVEQYAKSMFLERELFATSHRIGILFLVSLFERKIIILPDKGLVNQLSKDALQSIITSMTPTLKRRNIIGAFESGLDRLTHILGTTVQGTGENELPDEIIEEKGV